MSETPPRSDLYAALAAAREKGRPAEKGSKNEHHRYKYASAEAILETANEALHGTGLSLSPVSQVISDRPSGSVLVCSSLLAHSSGESLALVKEWPIVPGAGRPLDKAVASADTTALGYLLRDLLLMPRVDESDDMDHGSRDRRDHDAERRAAEAFEREQAAKAPKARRPQNAGPQQRPPENPSHNSQPTPSTSSSVQQGGGRQVTEAPGLGPTSPAPPAERPTGPTPVQEAAARRLGPAARQAITGTPDRPLSDEDEFALLVEIEAKVGPGHKVVKAWQKKYGPGADGKRTRLPTRENARGLIGVLEPEIEALAAKAAQQPTPQAASMGEQLEEQASETFGEEWQE